MGGLYPTGDPVLAQTVWDRLKAFDNSFVYALDRDFILRAQAAGFRLKRLPRFLGCFRVHDKQKTTVLSKIGAEEMRRLREKYLGVDVLERRPIHRAIRSYLRQHVFLHRLYKLKVLRY